MARSRSERDPTETQDSGIPAEAAGTAVFCVQGADPEVQAYAMAKYSRSALSMKQSLAELDEQKAEQFLNTFYFQYGHRSIADLAHITTAIERLSLLAAIAVVDEQRWDGQERSTRYQDFKKSSYFIPDFPRQANRHRCPEVRMRMPAQAPLTPSRIARLRRSCFPNTNRFPKKCSDTSPKALRGPPR